MGRQLIWLFTGFADDCAAQAWLCLSLEHVNKMRCQVDRRE